MPVTVEISISEGLVSNNTAEADPDEVPDPALLELWASAAYLKARPAIVSMQVTTAEEIQQLNKQYRDKAKATNVLSFPMQTPEEIDVSLLGDIALCATVINQESKQQAKAGKAHWAHMVVHGMLHLQGFDHINNKEAEEMEQLEIKILKQLGFDNPYC